MNDNIKKFDFSALDQSFQYIHTKTRPQHIAALAVFDGRLSVDILSKRLKEISSYYPRIKHTISDSYKITESISLNTNINQEVVDLLVSDFEYEDQLWDFHSFYQKEINQSYFLFKLHHSLADGLNGLGFFHHLLSNRFTEFKANKSYVPIYKSLKTLFSEITSKSGSKLPNMRIETNKRSLYTISIPYSKIQNIKSKYKCTSMTVALAISSKIIENIFGPISNYRALVPVAIDPRIKNLNLGNNIGAASININLNSPTFDSLIENISTQLSKKINAGGFGLYLILSNILKFLPNFLSNKLTKLASSSITAINTSLSGPKSDIFIDEAKLIYEFAIPALMPGQFIGFGFMKYKNMFNISIITDDTLKEFSTDFQTDDVLKKWL